MFDDEVLDDEDEDKDYLPIKRKRNKVERKVIARGKKESKNYVTFLYLVNLIWEGFDILVFGRFEVIFEFLEYLKI